MMKRSKLGRGGRLARLTGLLLSLTLLAACSGNKIKDEELTEPAKLEKIDQKVTLKRNWASKIGDGQGKAYVKLEPFYYLGSIYVASNDGVLEKLDAQTGDRVWRRKTRLVISGGVGMDDGQVFVGTIAGEVVAFSEADGSELWRTRLSSEILSAPRSDGDTVVVHSYDGKVFGLSHANGEKLWEYESQDPRLTLRGSSSPLMIEGVAVIGLANGKLVALDAETGLLRWEQRVAIAQGRSEIDRIVDIEGTPAQDGSLLFAVSYQGRVVVLDAGSGRILWRKEASSYTSVALGYGNVYVAEADGKLSAYKINDGSLQWQLEDLSWRKLSAPATIGAYVAVADFDGYIHLVSQLSGELVGRQRIDSSGVRAPLREFNSRLLAYSNGGRLVSYSLQE